MKQIFTIIIGIILTCAIANADTFPTKRTQIEEADTSPSGYPYKLIFPNSSLTDNGDGTTTIDFIAPLASTYLKLDASNQSSWTPTTTVVTNLNADLWDGYQFADYLNQAVLTTSAPTFATLDTGQDHR